MIHVTLSTGGFPQYLQYYLNFYKDGIWKDAIQISFDEYNTLANYVGVPETPVKPAPKEPIWYCFIPFVGIYNTNFITKMQSEKTLDMLFVLLVFLFQISIGLVVLALPFYI